MLQFVQEMDHFYCAREGQTTLQNDDFFDVRLVHAAFIYQAFSFFQFSIDGYRLLRPILPMLFS